MVTASGRFMTLVLSREFMVLNILRCCGAKLRSVTAASCCVVCVQRVLAPFFYVANAARGVSHAGVYFSMSNVVRFHHLLSAYNGNFPVRRVAMRAA
jgi:hypothetical protein